MHKNKLTKSHKYAPIIDSNTAFFHQSTIQRRRRNKLVRIRNEEGGWQEDPTRVRLTVEDHFQRLFTSNGNRDLGDILYCLDPVVTNDMNETLCSPISNEEIKDVVFNMGGSKAPGPDGFQGLFFQSYWDIIATEVHGIVTDCLRGDGCPSVINSTNIALIPKVPNPEGVNQFRPISLCNYSYKVLSKILANRLKLLLDQIISLNQNAFIKGRQIQENIILAHEIFHFLKMRRTKTKFEMGIKLDMNKAYDRVEWDFLEAVMVHLGFQQMWIVMVMKCVKTVEFSILINGMPGRTFKPTRGLRQGDPLSPYLFLLISEVLLLLISRAVQQGYLEGIKLSTSGPMLSHLLFADDTLIFLVATNQNYMPKVEDPRKYLDLPSIWGRSKKKALQFIKERILTKIAGWKRRFLSQAGKEVLIKAVIQTIPMYTMCVFRLPVSFCKDIDAAVARFWWAGADRDREVHWVKWNDLSRPKKERGLGFRNLNDFNIALLARQCWRLMHDPDSLWARVLKARYFPNSSFLEAKKGGRASWAWASLLEGRDLILKDARWQIMGGMEEDLARSMRYLIFTCWFIWRARCDAIFNGVKPSPRRSIRTTITALEFFMQASAPLLLSSTIQTSRPRGTRLLTLWSPPPVNKIKVNVDACWRRDSCCGKIGIVARDWLSGCREVKSVWMHASSVRMAEALAILEGCLLAKCLQVQEVVIESDAQGVIRSLNSPSLSCDWDLLPILSHILDVGRSFHSCSWSWIPRSANMAADFVTRSISPEMCSFGWVVQPPSSLVGILNKDGLPCPPL
ncbi:unnamed protein product [Malus baccata var. baccata]